MRAILTYHTIDDSGSPISCSPAAFRRHVRWLGSGFVEVTSLERLATLPDSADAIALTFDDGFANVASIAAPLLLDRGWTATVFVVPDHVGRTNAWGGVAENGIPDLPLMDWTTLARLHNARWSIGSHTRRHRELVDVSAADLEDEIAGGAALVEEHVGAAPTAFAYPHGTVTPAARRIVERTHAFGCTAEFRLLRAEDPAALLPRLDAYYFADERAFDAFGTTRFARRVATRHLLRRARRAPRRLAHRMLSWGLR